MQGKPHRSKNISDVVETGERKLTRLDEIWNRVAGIKSKEVPNFPHSPTGGVTPMSLRTRFSQERHRLGGDFTEKWRKWRVQWIKDQALHPLEPMYNADWDKTRLNVFRRAWRYPWNKLETWLGNFMHPRHAYAIRHSITISLRVYVFALSTLYFIKYQGRTWERGTRLRPFVQPSKERVLPGDPAYPFIGKTEKTDFFDLEFSDRKVLLFNPLEHMKTQ